MMRVVNVRPPGGLNDLSIIKQALPDLRSDDCLIKIMYSAVNRADILQRKGMYPVPTGETNIIGLEASGIVENAGSSKRWKKGDRVMALLAGGGYAEYARVHSGHLMRIPKALSFKQAAAIPEVWLTAFQLLFWISDIRSRLDEASSLSYLVHAGASGVGTALIQLIKEIIKSDNIFVTVGNDEKVEYLKRTFNFNDNNLINYRKKDFQSHIMNVTKNRGVDYIFDCVGGSYWQQNSEVLNIDSIWVLYGALGGVNVNGDILAKLLRKRAQIRATTLRSRSNEYKVKLIQDFEDTVIEYFETKQLIPIIDSEFDIDNIKDAHEHVESNKTIGKVLLKVSNSVDEIKIPHDIKSEL